MTFKVDLVASGRIAFGSCGFQGVASMDWACSNHT